jgi:hypothetical protein
MFRVSPETYRTSASLIERVWPRNIMGRAAAALFDLNQSPSRRLGEKVSNNVAPAAPIIGRRGIKERIS